MPGAFGLSPLLDRIVCDVRLDQIASPILALLLRLIPGLVGTAAIDGAEAIRSRAGCGVGVTLSFVVFVATVVLNSASRSTAATAGRALPVGERLRKTASM